MAPTVIVRREQLQAVGGFDESLGYACDYETWMKLCVEGRVGFVHQALVGYRWHADNASHQYQYQRGVEEYGLAMRAAVAYYADRTGDANQAQLLAKAGEAVLEQRHWAAELDRGRTWSAEQRASWQHTAEEQREWIANREQIIEEQRGWIAQLESGKRWLEQQGHNWQAQAAHWQAQTEHWRAQLLDWQARLWVRLGLRLGLLPPARELPAAPQSETQSEIQSENTVPNSTPNSTPNTAQNSAVQNDLE